MLSGQKHLIQSPLLTGVLINPLQIAGDQWTRHPKRTQSSGTYSGRNVQFIRRSASSTGFSRQNARRWFFNSSSKTASFSDRMRVHRVICVCFCSSKLMFNLQSLVVFVMTLFYWRKCVYSVILEDY